MTYGAKVADKLGTPQKGVYSAQQKKILRTWQVWCKENSSSK
jgi:hypothetical protein